MWRLCKSSNKDAKSETLPVNDDDDGAKEQLADWGNSNMPTNDVTSTQSSIIQLTNGLSLSINQSVMDDCIYRAGPVMSESENQYKTLSNIITKHQFLEKFYVYNS